MALVGPAGFLHSQSEKALVFPTFPVEEDCPAECEDKREGGDNCENEEHQQIGSQKNCPKGSGDKSEKE